VKLRPHAKMHKCAALALLQIQAGAVGICVQKTSEAVAMAAGGVNDIFISNEVIAPLKLRIVAELALMLRSRSGRLAIAVDSLQGIEALAHALSQVTDGVNLMDVFVEVDVGHGRCGANRPELAVDLAHAIGQHKSMRFAGLHAYQGGAQHLRSVQERQIAIDNVVATVGDTCALLEAAGMPVALVTGAGTGSFIFEAGSGIYGEIQAGSFMVMDADYTLNQGHPDQPVFEPALFIKAQVMSRGLAHAVCDAGHKSHAIDSGLPQVHCTDGHNKLTFANGGDEHGILRSLQPGGPLPDLGDIIWLIPGHCDPTINLHDQMLGVRGGLQNGVIEQIFRVDARGALT
jgi:D-serine deaminase-like pyridoxal phosphate-dependent protein